MNKKEKYSFARVILIAAACSTVIILLLVWFIFVFNKDDKKLSYSATQPVSVADGVAVTGSSSLGDFTIPEGSQYNFSMTWLPESMDKKDLKDFKEESLGFCTILALFNAKHEVIYATSASAITFDTTLFLDAGDYHLTGFYVTREADFVELAKEYLCSANVAAVLAKDHNFTSLPQNGTWNMRYDVNAVPVGMINQAKTTGIVLGILLGLCLVFILLAAGNKRHRLESPKYDERQELERGRGFRYAFFTSLIYEGILVCLDFTQLVSSLDSPFLHAFGLFLAVTVYVVYCIWHESYFAMNEKPKTLTISFLFIGLANLGISILHLIEGDLFVDGHVSYCILNLLCFLMFFALFVAMLLKKSLVSKNMASEEDDEEE